MPTRALIPFAVLIIAAAACTRRGAETTPPGYGEAVTAFYIGLVGDADHAGGAGAREVRSRGRARPAGAGGLGQPGPAAAPAAGARARARNGWRRPRRWRRRARRFSGCRRSPRAGAATLAAAVRTGGGRSSSIPRTREAAYALAQEIERQGGAGERGRGAARARAAARAAATTSRRASSTCASPPSAATPAALNAGLAPLSAAARAWSPQAQEQLEDAASPRPPATRARPRPASCS